MSGAGAEAGVPPSGGLDEEDRLKPGLQQGEPGALATGERQGKEGGRPEGSERAARKRGRAAGGGKGAASRFLYFAAGGRILKLFRLAELIGRESGE